MSKTLSRFMSINLLSFIFAPGVIIHELSHFFMATILFVSVGNIEFVPKKDRVAIKLGSIEIAKTDPIRRSVIGFAPILVGVIIIIGLVYLFSFNILFLQNKGLYVYMLVILALVYLLFAVSNTMFSSKADMNGTIEILITLLISLGVAYILGFRLQLSYFNKMFTKEFIGVIQKSTLFLLAPITIDLFILGAIRLFTGRRESRI